MPHGTVNQRLHSVGVFPEDESRLMVEWFRREAPHRNLLGAWIGGTSEWRMDRSLTPKSDIRAKVSFDLEIDV